jgi:putative ABC transport system ATP-binding protein
MPVRDVLLEAHHIGRNIPSGGGMLLADVLLAVSAGTRVALVGPSGAGKTLLLRAMAMLDPVDRGDIRWRGGKVHGTAVPAFRKAVAYLHQRASMLEDTVEAALRRPFTLKAHHGKRFDRARVVELLAMLGRDESFLEKSSRDLSGGEIQLVALVRAVQLDPTVLLLDEPTAALDAPAATAVEALLGRWIAEPSASRAWIWVSHDAHQAQRVGDVVVTMDTGRIVGG